jgi:hypothetical protein
MNNSQQMAVAELFTVHASNGTATAGGAGDATEVDGAWVARHQTGKGIAKNAKLVITYDTTLAAAATLSFAVNAQDATDGSGTGAADTINAYAATVVATGPGGGGTVKGTLELDFNLAQWRSHFRSQITPNLSAANTDTVRWQATWVLAGFDRGPASGSVVQMSPLPT